MKNFLQFKSFLLSLVAIISLILLQGCGQVGYHELLPNFMPQHTREKSSNTTELLNKVRKENLRSENVYKQFQTVALFDILRYSKNTVSAAAQVKADKYGLTTTKARQEIINTEIDKASDELIFLVQADVRKAIEPDLSKNSCPWTFSLVSADGQIFTPTIQKIKHSQITKILFGSTYSKFKTFYKLSFGLPKDPEKSKILYNEKIKLICRSSQNEFTLNWEAEN